VKEKILSLLSFIDYPCFRKLSRQFAGSKVLTLEADKKLNYLF
jgi:hypothetical protein